MEKNKNLEQVLQYLPNTTITYKQKPHKSMDIPYMLTAKGYKKIYLNAQELEDLSPKEQLILLYSNNNDPTYTPSTTLAGIFIARGIQKRSKNSSEAIGKCNKLLVDLNKEEFQVRSSIQGVISEKIMHSNLLEYYLKAEKAYDEYERREASIFAPLLHLKDNFLTKITKRPHGQPPCSMDEIERGHQEWAKFREEQGANNSVSNRTLLTRYRYNSDIANNEPFSFLYNNPELSAISEEYLTTNIALQILDGSAYKKAESTLNRNPYQFIKKVKSMNREK